MTNFKYLYKNSIFAFALCFCNNFLFAQNENKTEISLAFNQYQSQILYEKVYLHTDKSFYVAGEIIWFKGYVVDGGLGTPSDLSKVLYIEIINSSNEAIIQSKIELIKGLGNGSITIPGSLGSGSYRIRAYTKWMKNFQPDLYFSKNISIINPQKKPVWNQIPKKEYAIIELFPEGGNLVYGIRSKVAFHLINNLGEGIAGNGYVLNENNDTTCRFKTGLFGMGYFYFTPQIGHTYKVFTNTNGYPQLIKNIEEIKAKGWVMSLLNLNDNKIKISVESNNSLQGEIVYLIGFTQQTIKISEQLQLLNGKSDIIISKEKFGDGISTITLFDINKNPICERLLFKDPQKKLKIELNKFEKEYEPRTKVTVLLKTKDHFGFSASANLSSSVYLTDPLQNQALESMLSYFYLSGDLIGHIENPSYYFENKSIEAIESLDLLLLIHGWRKYNWNDILLNRKPVLEFLPEYEGPIINAEITQRDNLTPIIDSSFYISLPGTNFDFSSTTCNRNGKLQYLLKNEYASGSIIFHPISNNFNGFNVKLNSPFSTKFPMNLPLPFSFDSSYKKYFQNRIISAQVENAYLLDIKEKYNTNFIDTLSFYGIPDKKYFLDDYTRFKTMEEVLREYIPEVRIRKENQLYYFRVENKPRFIFFETNPLVLLDGIPVLNISTLMNINPLKIKTAEVIARKYYLGKNSYDGIVSFKSYDGNTDMVINSNTVKLDFEGLQLQREFYSPKYESQKEINCKIPDYRNLLYWAPTITTDFSGNAEFSFYTSDLQGKYAIIVQGITSSGEIGSASEYIIVK